MRAFLIWLALTAASAAQPLPTGVREDMVAVGQVTMSLLRFRVTTSGVPFAIEAKGTDGVWRLLSSPADHNPQSSLIDQAGCPQVCSNGPGSEQRFWHSPGAYAIYQSGVWVPRLNQVTSRDPLEQLGVGPWTCETDGLDSLFGADPPAVHWKTTLTPIEGSGYSQLSVSTDLTRLPALPHLQIKSFQNPSLVLDLSRFSHVSFDGGLTLVPVASIPSGASGPGATLIPPPSTEVWLRTAQGNRWLILRWPTQPDVNALRTYTHPEQAPVMIVVSPLITASPLAVGQTRPLNYSLRVR